MDKDDFYRDALSDTRGPLEGLLVVEAATTWAGPLAACLLGDHGADVIKVEEPGGDVGRRIPPLLPGIEPPLSFFHATVNRNKRSLMLDLHEESNGERLLKLLEQADVFIHSFRPGVLDGWGLGYTDVKERNPGLVYVSVSGFGQYGPNRERAGYDPLAQAVSGFMSLNGTPEHAPTKAPTFLGDDLAGLNAAFAAMTALWHRQSTGHGQHVDIAVVDSMMAHTNGFLTLGAMGVNYPRVGNEFIFAAPVNVYPCTDGPVYAGVLLDQHWSVLARTIGRPELAENPDYLGSARIARRDEVDKIYADWLAEKTVTEAVDIICNAGLPIGPIQDLQTAARDPQTGARDMLQDLEYADGQTVPVTGPPAKLSRTPLKLRSSAPSTVGEHTDEILEEFNL